MHRWVQRAGTERLDRVDFSDRSHAPLRPRKFSTVTEEQVLDLRRKLSKESDLGEFGAVAIHRELERQGLSSIPSTATINRILRRHGAFDGRRRVRRPAPPKGWYLPEVSRHRVELDSFDIIEDLTILGGTHVEILTGVSLHGGLVASWPLASVSAQRIVECLTGHWRKVGLPAYAQFDNDTRFQGPHNRPDVIGRVSRVCLQLGIIPVFAPPRESGFQAGVESFNGLWQLKVWRRFHHASLEEVQERSDRYVVAHRQRAAERIESAPSRGIFPASWEPDYSRKLEGRMVFLRRSADDGSIRVLERSFDIDRHWTNRLVRVEVELDEGKIRCFALRRRDPEHQPLLREIDYEIRKAPFRE